jgi:hypothetical protein
MVRAYDRYSGRLAGFTVSTPSPPAAEGDHSPIGRRFPSL